MKLAAIFSDGMILQRDKEVYVFGESDTSEAIKSPVVDEDFLREEEKFCWHRCQNGDFSEMSGIGYFFVFRYICGLWYYDISVKSQKAFLLARKAC